MSTGVIRQIRVDARGMDQSRYITIQLSELDETTRNWAVKRGYRRCGKDLKLWMDWTAANSEIAIKHIKEEFALLVSKGFSVGPPVPDEYSKTEK